MTLAIAVGALGCGAAPPATASASPSSSDVSEASPTASATECDVVPAANYDGPIAIEKVNIEASGQLGPAGCDPTEVVRRALEGELAAIDWTAERLEGRFTMNATVVELMTEEASFGVVAHSTVSTTLIHDKAGLVAAMKGRAHAEDERTAGDRAELNALDAAARGSLRGLRQALASVD